MNPKILAAMVAALSMQQQTLAEISEKESAIVAKAEAEARDLTADETKELDELKAKFEKVEADIKRREEIIARAEKLAAPEQRVTKPGDLEVEASGAPASSGRITGGDRTEAMKRTFGFAHLGDFMNAVRNAKNGAIDDRLKAALSTYGNEGNNADGGFAVPPDFRDAIYQKVQSEESLLARTDQQVTSSNKMTVPKDDGTPWGTSGGIQVYCEDEAGAITQSKPELGSQEVKLHKITALVPLTDELMEDAPSVSAYLPGKVATKFTSKLNDLIVNGNGVGKMLGLMSSGSKVTVAKETGQAADSIVFNNLAKMWARMYAPLRAGAVWLCNQDIEPQLLGLTAPGSNFPAYLGPNGISGSPYGTLLGRPVIPVETCETVGDEGDLILTNLSTYLTLQKVRGGVRQDVSIHLYFDQGATAFRFVMRVGGQSWWNSAITRQKGSNTLSNVVTLADRA